METFACLALGMAITATALTKLIQAKLGDGGGDGSQPMANDIDAVRGRKDKQD